MFRTLTIENFRAFRQLRLTGLGRVNLLVGSNNSGKTSVLEALHFLALGGDLRALIASLSRRAEDSLPSREESRHSRAFDARHLFHGRSLEGDPLRVSCRDANSVEADLSVAAPRLSAEDEEQLSLWRREVRRSMRHSGDLVRTEEEIVEQERVPRFLEVRSGNELIGRAALQLGGILTEDAAMIVGSGNPSASVQFISTSSLSQASLARLYDRVVLTAEEPGVVLALNTVEDTVTRIAAVERGMRSRAIVVGVRGTNEPVPLGSLGDGMSRMLAIALSLAASRDGFLLIDEIDTGLHHTVMRRMWRLVFETASRLNVRVFATTHSYDCVHALAAITNGRAGTDGDVSLIRVDRENPDGVHFNEREIAALASREIEPR
ncbi:MAG: AAA family ATPase [Deltaproteobacteria bacterium]|nr:AAA family ATPase [Deltaproteobacteria bacterium]